MLFARVGLRAQANEWAVLVLLYFLQISDAEMLRRSAGSFITSMDGSDGGRLVAGWCFLLSHRVHPVAMVVFGVWLATMVLLLGRGRLLPRWSFDGAGLWFALRMLAEYITINGLIFEGSKVPPSLLLGQIVVYLPYFVLSWGWIFYRFDLVGQSKPGRFVRLSDVDPGREISGFDYYHSAINTLLNKGHPTITGVSRGGRLLVLLYLIMMFGLYALTFARIIQLTKSVI